MSQTVTVFSSPYGARIGETKETAFVFISLRRKNFQTRREGRRDRKVPCFVFISLRSKVYQRVSLCFVQYIMSWFSSPYGAEFTRDLCLVFFSSPYGARFTKVDAPVKYRHQETFHLPTEKDFPNMILPRRRGMSMSVFISLRRKIFQTTGRSVGAVSDQQRFSSP